MTKDVFYRDITILQGEDTVFVASGVFRALHGYQRGSGAKLVTVPFTRNNDTNRIVRPGELPTSFRVFSDSRETLEGIDLRGPIEDAVKIGRIKLCEGDNGAVIDVSRLRFTTNSNVVRAEKRGWKAESIKAMRDKLSRLGKAGNVFFWLQKGSAKYPFFLDIDVRPKCDFRFSSNNTYGCGIAPFVDFSK